MSSDEQASGDPRLGVFLAAAMFVFVIDTSFMNVSISAVVRDLDTTVSGVQSAVAIESLVSAAFILISSKLGDLFGRKRAFVTGLLFYLVGAGSMIPQLGKRPHRPMVEPNPRGEAGKQPLGTAGDRSSRALTGAQLARTVAPQTRPDRAMTSDRLEPRLQCPVRWRGCAGSSVGLASAGGDV